MPHPCDVLTLHRSYGLKPPAQDLHFSPYDWTIISFSVFSAIFRLSIRAVLVLFSAMARRNHRRLSCYGQAWPTENSQDF